MFSKKEIMKLGNETYSKFYNKHKIECKIKIISEKKFWNLAKKSELVKNKIKEGIPIIIGALVSHEKIGDTIYVSDEVINTLTNDSDFVKSIFLHEFFHIYLKYLVKNKSLKEASLSEERVKSEMKKEFPDLAKYIR
jgi:isopentenyl phosphate kinase